MSGHIIIGIDPGRITAWAALELTGNSVLKLRGYGIIQQLEPGDAALIKSVERFLDTKKETLTMWSLAWESGILSHAMHSDETTSKIRGTVQSWAIRNAASHGEYSPSTVKATVCAHREGGAKKSKADVAYAVKDLIPCAWLKTTYDDIFDAIAIGITHAIKSHHYCPSVGGYKKGKDRFSTAAIKQFNDRMGMAR